jgi:hypothetical protein
MPSSASVLWPRSYRNIALILLLLGISWRVLRYLIQFPIWGDEASVCLNLMDRDYLGLMRPLRYVQVAPLLFLWSELAAFRLLGGGEWALRLLPFFAGLGSLFLFWNLVRRVLPPLAGVLAIGILAVAYYPVRHTCEVKPYAFDLFVALALLLAAVNFLHDPQQRRWLIVLSVLVPIALGLSYPAVFVAGAVSVALLPTLWRGADWRAWCWYAAYNGLLVATFLAIYLVAGTGQYASTGGTENDYWADWFPPGAPLALLRWLARVHTGNLMAYPVGGRDGTSVVTCLLAVTGLCLFIHARRWQLLALLLVPFALTFLAAALHRYPYGGSARIAQHLAPSICVLAGAGTAAVLAGAARWIGSEQRWGAVLCGLLALVGVVGMARDWRKPYKTENDRLVRQIVADVVRQAGPDDQIVVLDANRCAPATFEWYLRQHADRVVWEGAVDWDRLQARGRLWGLSFRDDDSARSMVARRLAYGARPMLLTVHQTYDLQLGPSEDPPDHCELCCWVGMYGDLKDSP